MHIHIYITCVCICVHVCCTVPRIVLARTIASHMLASLCEQLCSQHFRCELVATESLLLSLLV